MNSEINGDQYITSDEYEMIQTFQICEQMRHPQVIFHCETHVVSDLDCGYCCYATTASLPFDRRTILI